MKNFRIYATTLMAFALLTISNIQAQPQKKVNWQEKMQCEKIAFITEELNLSPEEAQTFWPVYNQIAKEKQDAQKACSIAFRALKKAMEEGTTSGKELERLLDEYLTAKDLSQKSWKENADKFRKVLTGDKVAKLYLAEDKFRRQHIRNMKADQRKK